MDLQSQYEVLETNNNCANTNNDENKIIIEINDSSNMQINDMNKKKEHNCFYKYLDKIVATIGVSLLIALFVMIIVM
jgi:hypothetical protein